MKRGNKTENNKNKTEQTKEKEEKPGNSNYQPISAPSYLPKRLIQIQDITPIELIFAYEWANNPTKPDIALLNAGITAKTDTIETIKILTKEYTNNPQVIKAFSEAMQNRLESIAITENRVDAHLSVIAHTDTGKAVDKTGGVIPLQEMPWEVRFCIQEYEEKMFYPKDQDPFKRTKIKFYSRMEALKALRASKKDDKALVQKNGDTGITYIQNNIGTQNNQNNNNFQENNYNHTIQAEIDLSLLGPDQLSCLLIAIKNQLSHEVLSVEDWVNKEKRTKREKGSQESQIIQELEVVL